MNQSMDLALSGMRASQLAMDITSHNIANSSTKGYARQRVNLAAKVGYIGRSSLIGGGVEVASVQRISDRFVARQIRQQVGEQGYYAALQSRLSDVEAIFNEADDNGLQQAFADFYSGLATVASHPEDSGVRVAALNNGQLMATKIRDAKSRLVSLDHENRLQLDFAVTEVNANLERLAALNGKIAGTQAMGSAVADLQNERDQLLEDVAKALHASISVTQDDGLATVTLQGQSLVLGAQAVQLQVTGSGLQVVGSSTVLTAGQGEIGAMMELRDTTLPGYMTDLDTMATAIITDFNAVHSAGYGLDGTTGVNLFSGADATDIEINPALLAAPRQFAASSNGEPGDIATIEAMLALRDQGSIAGATHEEYYAQIVGGVGAEMKAAVDNDASIQTILTALENRRDSVSGVSLDEEMTDLIRLQQSYNAAARIVAIVDEMYQVAVNLGR